MDKHQLDSFQAPFWSVFRTYDPNSPQRRRFRITDFCASEVHPDRYRTEDSTQLEYLGRSFCPDFISLVGTIEWRKASRCGSAWWMWRKVLSSSKSDRGGECCGRWSSHLVLDSSDEKLGLEFRSVFHPHFQNYFEVGAGYIWIRRNERSLETLLMFRIRKTST